MLMRRIAQEREKNEHGVVPLAAENARSTAVVMLRGVVVLKQVFNKFL